MGNDWLISIETIREAFSTDVFEPPGRVAKLPDALGGDPRRWSRLRGTLRAKANPGLVNKDAFFGLLWAKAHFFVLPKPIVTFMKYSSRVFISEEATSRGVTANTKCKDYADQQGKWAYIYIPGASNSLVRVGHGLGGAAMEILDPFSGEAMAPLNPFDTEECAILGTIYHEMTHAWLCLQEFSDEAIKKLYNDGGYYYRNAVDTKNKELDRDVAFTEAAAAHVEERISRWCESLWRIAQVLHDPPKEEERDSKLQSIIDTYDAPLGDPGKVEGKKIASPMLSQDLRDALDRTILDGLPLTKQFKYTKLARVLNPLMPEP